MAARGFGCGRGGLGTCSMLLVLGAEDFCDELVLFFARVRALATLLSLDAHVVLLGVAADLRARARANVPLD